MKYELLAHSLVALPCTILYQFKSNNPSPISVLRKRRFGNIMKWISLAYLSWASWWCIIGQILRMEVVASEHVTFHHFRALQPCLNLISSIPNITKLQTPQTSIFSTNTH